jgi:hypothetical protein
MLNNYIRILDFDGSVTCQEKLLGRYQNKIMNLTDLGPKVRLWMNSKDRQTIEEQIKHSAKNCLTFLGSGDFHHVSHILISRFVEPISLIVFDFHPDWSSLPTFGCGTWVTSTMKNKNVLKCLLIGVSSKDISGGTLQITNLSLLENSRVEIYPYIHQSSLVFLKSVPENASMILKRSKFSTRIQWVELKTKNLSEFFPAILRRLPTTKAYVSIDKDCLMKKYAVTNWEQGAIPLEKLLLMLKLTCENLDIVGADITGDYSKIVVEGKFKTAFSSLAHPRHGDAYYSAMTDINEETNLRILEAINIDST